MSFYHTHAGSSIQSPPSGGDGRPDGEHASLSSLKWRAQLRASKENAAYNEARPKKNSGGLSQIVQLMKSASEEKEAFSGRRRKPLGNVSNGNKLLQSKAASKRELQKIQSKLPEIC